MKRSKLNRRETGRWQPLVRVFVPPLTPEQISARLEHVRKVFPDLPDDQIVARFEEPTEVWENDQYQVHVRRHAVGDDDNAMPAPMVHLSIKTVDKRPMRDWRDCQRIKNQLVGPECEAVELYPAESRMVDTANSYHLWVMADPEFRFPIGFFSGRRVTSESGGGTRQRPFDDEAA